MKFSKMFHKGNGLYFLGDSNPNLEDSYLLKYIESETETFTQGTSQFHIRPVNISAPDPSPNLSYSESPNMNSFFLLGFSNMKP